MSLAVYSNFFPRTGVRFKYNSQNESDAFQVLESIRDIHADPLELRASWKMQRMITRI
jgi:hypothetical protein